MACRRSGKRRKSTDGTGRGRSAHSRMPSKPLPSTIALHESFELREEGGFVLVDAEESMVEKMQLEIQSLKDDKEALKKQVNSHLHTEVELLNRVEDLEKQSYRDNEMQARMEEVEAKLEALRLENSRLESEKSTLKTQVESQRETFEQTIEHQAYKVYMLEAESHVMTERIQQLEEANKLFVLVAHNVKEALWKREQSGEPMKHTVCDDVLQGLSYSGRVALPPDVTLPDAANILPVSTETLVEFIPEMAQKWEFIGHKLGLASQVMALRTSEKPAETKCLAMLAEWVQSGREVTWQQLLKVLTNSGILLYNVASKIKQHLLDNAL